MSTELKGNTITKNNSNVGVQPTTPGGRMQDVESPLAPEDKFSAQEVAEAQDEPLRGNTVGGHTRMYVYDRNVKAEKFGTDAIQKTGAPSLFNPFSIFTHPGANTYNDFYDRRGRNNIFPKFENQNAAGGGTGGRNLTIESLLSDFSPEGGENGVGDLAKGGSSPYYASDFLYCRYYKRIPLNRLITLRRFPFPTYDNLEFVGEANDNRFKPIAQAVTYFGEPTGNELKELTKWTGQVNWEELTADVHDVEGNERGFDGSPFGGTGGIGKAANALINPSAQDLGGFRAEEIEAQKFNTFEYTNKVLGPVNVVNQTYVRQRGLGSKKEFSIVFEYELKSYNNINPRLAMLDLLCNMLALTFNNARFWGGANRYFPKSPQFGFVGDQDAFYDGRYGEYLDGVLKQMSVGAGDIFNKLSKMVSSLLQLDFSGILDIGKKAAFTWMDLKRAKSRPQVLGFHALLTGLPIGEWHITIGNPYRPIMQIGNLICKGFDFEFSEHLGVDDFPSVLRFVVNLETGRPRDKGDLESIFQFGEGRMYYPPEGLIDVTNTSTAAGNVPDAGGGNTSKNRGGGFVRPPASAQSVGRTPAYNRASADPEFAKKLIGTNY